MDPGDPSRESDYVIFRERKLVTLTPVLNGMKRFSFLLETCHPGSVPDHHLLAAILDLVFYFPRLFSLILPTKKIPATCPCRRKSIFSLRMLVFCTHTE